MIWYYCLQIKNSVQRSRNIYIYDVGTSTDKTTSGEVTYQCLQHHYQRCIPEFGVAETKLRIDNGENSSLTPIADIITFTKKIKFNKGTRQTFGM